MKTFTALAAAALVTFTLTTGTANAQMAGLAAANAPAAQAGQDIVHKTGSRRGRHGGKIAAGIALGILGAAAIASQSHRYHRDSYESRHERRCRGWMYRCDDGDYRACRKFDRRC